jgi:hypothetical protein
MNHLEKNKDQRPKATSNKKEDRDNMLLNRIIKTRQEIVDLLKVLKTF